MDRLHAIAVEHYPRIRNEVAETLLRTADPLVSAAVRQAAPLAAAACAADLRAPLLKAARQMLPALPATASLDSASRRADALVSTGEMGSLLQRACAALVSERIPAALAALLPAGTPVAVRDQAVAICVASATELAVAHSQVSLAASLRDDAASDLKRRNPSLAVSASPRQPAPGWLETTYRPPTSG
jgi:hypothetical protein